MLERKINKIIESITQASCSSIESWRWLGLPLSATPEHWDSLQDRILFEEVDWAIQCSSISEAATSPSLYIRECRRWFDAQRS